MIRAFGAHWRIEANRELLPDLVAALHEARLFRMLVPRSLGGEELSPVEYVQAIEEKTNCPSLSKPQIRDGRHSGGDGARAISFSAMKHRLDLSGDYVAATIRAREAGRKSLREAEQAYLRVLQTKLERALLAIISVFYFLP